MLSDVPEAVEMTTRAHEKDDPPEAAAEKRRLLELLKDIQAIGTPPGVVQERDSFEFPDRQGL